MIQERRHHQRLVLDPPPSVYLGGSQFGNVLDLCEGGVAVKWLSPGNQDPIISLEFNLPGGGGHIEARAEIAWTSDAHHRTGLRFVDLADASRVELRDWVSARAYGTAQSATKMETAQLPLPSETISTPISTVSRETRDEEVADWRAALAVLDRTSRFANQEQPKTGESVNALRKLRHAAGLAFALAIFVPAFIFLGHLLGNRGYNPQAKETMPAANSFAPAARVDSRSAEPAPAASPSLLVALPYDVPGFVLQVGAMAHEDKADALKQSLEQKDFPVFIFRHSSGRLYRVAVGPYGDARTAARVKEKLAVQGFEAIVKPWSPE